MPAYIVRDRRGTTGTVDGVKTMSVFAATAADARAAANSLRTDDTNDIWTGADVDEIVADTDAGVLAMVVAVLDNDPPIQVTADASDIGAFSATIAAGGSGYVDNEILTLVGGTSTRAATFRVTSQSAGVVDGIELVDPGIYTAVPSDPVSTTSSASGTGCTLNVTSGTDRIENVAAKIVDLLNANADIAAAAIDFGASPAPLLTIAGVSDSLGDKQVKAEITINGVVIPSFVGTITDEGVAGAALTAALAATPVYPQIFV